MQFNSIDIWSLQAVLLDLLVVVVLLVSLKFVKGLLSNVNSQSELVDKNNAAFGISFGGGILALGIVLTGVSSGEFADSLVQEVLSMAVFGVVGLVLILVGRLVQDKLVLRQIDIHGELAKNNVACALVDVGHMVAIGLIIRAAMIWIPTADFSIIPLLLVAFVLSQLVMLLASAYRIKLFKSRNTGHSNCLQSAISEGNAALALRYGAFMVGAALTVTAASHLVVYNPDNQWLSAVFWSGISVVSVLVFALLVLIVRKLVLSGVDVAEEVDREKNTGIAAVEGAIFVAVGAVLTALI
ncbi:DUF350 domain-containing protein [Pleionea sediminis]|uniref:DUF350 domain-containing protein n=1 Tax=Pleionea sediminis TaxID=2569479 RepID=UPI0013DE3ECB|nr:DUF350 domain-containing protein [Pleionea sediminis]